MRVWRVESIREYLSSAQTTWVWNEEFSSARLDVWESRDESGRHRFARLQCLPATSERPAVVFEVGLATFCRQLGNVDLRAFTDALGPDAIYRGSL